MKTLVMTILFTTIIFAQGQDFAVPPGYEIVARDGNRVEVKDLTTGYVTPYLIKSGSDSVQTPIINETQDELPGLGTISSGWRFCPGMPQSLEQT